MGVEDSGVTSLIKASYELLGLASLTAGKKKPGPDLPQGDDRPQCAGVIHTDFEKAFIKAEVVSYEDLIAAGSMQKGMRKATLKGKEYARRRGRRPLQMQCLKNALPPCLLCRLHLNYHLPF